MRGADRTDMQWLPPVTQALPAPFRASRVCL